MFATPTLPQVTALLDRCGLPSDDLVAGALDDFLLVQEDGTSLGVVGLQLEGEYGLLRSLAVAPDARGRGLGALLVQAAEERARAKGVRTLFLLTTDASRFFERFGYVGADRGTAPDAIRATSQFGSCCCASATFMTKAL